MLKPKVVLLIFVSGKIVLTGAKVSSTSSVMLLSSVPSCGYTLVSAVPSCRVDENLVHPSIVFVEPRLTPPLPTFRSGKRSTRRSTPFIPCCASSASLDGPDRPAAATRHRCRYAVRSAPRSLFLSTGPVVRMRAGCSAAENTGLLWRGPRGEADVVHAGCFSYPPSPMPSLFPFTNTTKLSSLAFIPYCHIQHESGFSSFLPRSIYMQTTIYNQHVIHVNVPYNQSIDVYFPRAETKGRDT